MRDLNDNKFGSACRCSSARSKLGIANIPKCHDFSMFVVLCLGRSCHLTYSAIAVLFISAETKTLATRRALAN
jgi:hypothetical protein